MTVRAPVEPHVIAWALDRSGLEAGALEGSVPKLEPWLRGESEARPTLVQVQRISRATGVPLGYLFLPEPPELELPIPDFRGGHAGVPEVPSAALMAVIHQSIRRQDWYRDYAEANGLPPLDEVGRGDGMSAIEAARDMRQHLRHEVTERSARRGENRRGLLGAFEELGGLTVATSMVGNNTHRLLDPDEFRGFALSDSMAPLIFINTRQTLNAQLFTIAHEIAHVWQGSTGVSLEEPFAPGQLEVERWCNDVAAEFLVPSEVLRERYDDVRHLELTPQLEALADAFRCGTLVVLQALRRQGVRDFDDFDAVYRHELERVMTLANGPTRGGSGGDYWANQPYRIGSRLARAIARDTVEGHTGAAEAVQLTGLGSLDKFQELTRRLDVA